MKKRMTDSDIWDDPWYRKLPPVYKLLWNFLCNKCDIAGVWKTDFEMAGFCIGESISEKAALELFNSDKVRVVEIPGDRWFITGFIDFQYGGIDNLSPDSRPHRAVKEIVEKLGLEEVLKGLSNPYQRAKDKDKDQDKDSHKEGSGEKKTPAPTFTLPEWIPNDVWSAYVEMRKKKRAPLTPKAVELTIEKLARFKAEGHDPVEIINRSIMHSWTGVFAPDGGRASPSRPSQVHPLSHEVVSKKNFKEGAPANWFDPPPRKEPAKFEEEFTGGEDGK